MNVQPNEALREARERIAELEAQVFELEALVPREEIEGVRPCMGNGAVYRVMSGELSPDEGEVVAAKIMRAVRMAREEGL
jgi:polyhydroxyalkanoate synthesis regulator phasin